MNPRLFFSILLLAVASLCLTSCGGGGSTVSETAAKADQVVGLTLTPVSANRVDLSWVASSGAVRYQVFLAGSVTPLAEVSTTSYSDTGVRGGTSYSYQIKAVNRLGEGSELSVSQTVTTPPVADTGVPSAPANLVATARGPQHVSLSWTASSDNVAVVKYLVFRADQLVALAETSTPGYDDMSVTAGGTFGYQVQALDAVGNSSPLSGVVTVLTPSGSDTLAPSTPGDPRAVSISPTRVDLAWAASTDNVGVAKYQVLRVGVAGVLAETTNTSYADTTVVGSTNYSYQVKALDAANNASALSASATVTTPAAPDTTPPSTPVGLSATAPSATRVTLSWSASTDNVGVAKYQVFRVGVAGVLAETTNTSYADTTVVGSTTYSYQVKALDAANNASSLSAGAAVTTPAAPDTTAPSTPSGLSATAPSATRVTLSWSASTDNVGVAKYQVFRVGVTGVLAETTTTSYTDNTVGGGTGYSYQVKALDAANNASSLSSSASVTTPAALSAPVVTTQPLSQTVAAGASAVFTAAATGNPAPTWQWQRSTDSGTSWSNIAGQTGSVYTLSNAQPSDSAAKFRNVATNSQGTANTSAATLTVTTSAAFHVSTTGSNSNTGSLAQPWKTIAYAVATAPAGATVYVKAGLYSESVTFSKDDQTLIGYKTTPGDQPPILANATDPFAAFDKNEQPLIDGGNRAAGVGVSLRGRKNITIKNIAISNFAYGLIAGNDAQGFVENHTLFNVNVSTVGNLSSGYSGLGISFGSMGTKYSNANKITHSLIVNAAAEGLTLNGNDNTADNVKVYCNDTTNANAATDYYIMVTGNNNVVRNSLVNRKPGLAHFGHGFSVKSNAEQVVDQGKAFPVVNPQFNVFENNVAINVGEGFVVRHRGTRHNTFKNNFAYGTHTGHGNCGDGNGISIRDGASDNLFINTVIENTCDAISFNDTVEDGDTGSNPPGHPGHNNVIDGAKVKNSYLGVNFSEYSVPSDAGVNTIKNTSFVLTRYMHYVARRATQMKYINNSYSGTNAVSPKPGGYFRGSSYSSDVVPAQFTGCTYSNIEGGMPAGF